MKKLATIFIFALPILAHGQGSMKPLWEKYQRVEYQITGSKDSFFLDEIVTTLDTNGVAIGVSKSSQLFRSKDQLFYYIGNLHNQAKKLKVDAEEVKQEAAAKAGKIIDDAADRARKMIEASPKIEDIANKIDAVARRSDYIFTGEKPETPPKPKKKKAKN